MPASPSHWRSFCVSFAPQNTSPKAFQDPLVNRAEHLHYCSKSVNLYLVHPDGAQSKSIYIWLDYTSVMQELSFLEYKELNEYSKKIS
jgi:hypothetical protein